LISGGIEIKENNTQEENKIVFEIGLLSADASACIILDQSFAEGSIDFSGIFELENFNLSASTFQLKNFTIAGTISFSAGAAGNLYLSWNDTGIILESDLDVSGALQCELLNFYVHVGSIPLTASIKSLTIKEGYFEVSLGKILRAKAGAMINITKLHANVGSNFSGGFDILNAIGEIGILTDLSSWVSAGAEGYIYISNISVAVPPAEIYATIREVEAEGWISVYLSTSGHIRIAANGTIEIKLLDAYLAGISVGFDRLKAEGGFSIAVSPSGMGGSAEGYIEIEQFYLSMSGLAIRWVYLYATGAVSAYLGGHISFYAGGYLTINSLYVSALGLEVNVSKITASGEVSLYIGSYISASAKISLYIGYTTVSGAISLTMDSLILTGEGNVYLGSHVEGGATGSLTINSVAFSGGGFSFGFSKFSLSGNAKGYFGNNRIEIGGYKEETASAELYISNGYAGSISQITGTFGFTGSGSADLTAGNVWEYSASAGAYANGVIFKGSKFDFTMASFNLNCGGSGSFTGETKTFIFEGSASVIVNSLDMNSPVDVEVPSLSLSAGSRLLVQAVSSSNLNFEANGGLSGYVILGGMLIQISLDGDMNGDIDWSNNLHGSISGTGHLTLHIESGGTLVDINLIGSGGSLNVDLSGDLTSWGNVVINTGGWSATISLTKGSLVADIQVSGDIDIFYRKVSMSQARGTISSSTGCSATIDISYGGTPALEVSIGGGSGGGSVNVMFKSGGELPPDYCSIDASFPSASLSFNFANILKGSVGPGNAYLRWDKYAPFGDRLTISGDLSGSLQWNKGGWITIWPWPWMEGVVTLSAKGPEGSWSKDSVAVEPGETVNFKAEINEDEGENNDQDSDNNDNTNTYSIKLATVNDDGTYRFDFYYGDSTPGSSSWADQFCYSSHSYDGIGVYTASVIVFDENDYMIGTDTVVVEVGKTLQVSLTPDKTIKKSGETFTFKATVTEEDDSSNPDQTDNTNPDTNFDILNLASNTNQYQYKFTFEEDKTYTITGGNTVTTTYQYFEIGKKVASVHVTKLETNEFGGASCTVWVINGLKVRLTADPNLVDTGQSVKYTAKVITEDESEDDSTDTQNEGDNTPSFGSLGDTYNYDFDIAGYTVSKIGGTSVQLTHTFSESGIKLATVTVTNPETNEQGIAFAVVIVLGGLEVSLTSNTNTPDIGEHVSFTAKVTKKSSSDSNIDNDQSNDQDNTNFDSYATTDDEYEYVFDFDDGSSDSKSSGNQASTSHPYSESGDYLVKVTVTGNDGNTGAATTWIFVGGQGIVQASPGTLNFGTLGPGDSKTLPFTVSNIATEPEQLLNWKVEDYISWASCSPKGGTDMAPGGSKTVSVTVTAPELNDIDSDDNGPDNAESEDSNMDLVYSFDSFTATEPLIADSTKITTTTTITDTFEGIIEVVNSVNPADYDVVYIKFVREAKVTVADSGTDVDIHLDSTIAEQIEIDMIPKNYINSDTGEVQNIDDEGYSIVANQDGTYDIAQNNVIVQQGLASSTEVRTYISTNIVGTGDDNTGDDDTGDDDTGDDDTGDDDADDDPTNHAPFLNSISDKSVTEGNTISFTIFASDSDGDSLSFSKSGVGTLGSSGYSYASDGGTSTRSVTYRYTAPQDSDCNDETKTVTITVRDGRGGSDSDTFKIRVNDDDSCDDDCCFPAGTLISMADNTTKDIGDVRVGDFVKSFDLDKQEVTICRVLQIVTPIREGVYSINDGLVKPTDDHPFYVKKVDGTKCWASINPEHSTHGYNMDVLRVEVDDMLFSIDSGWIKVEKIDYIPGCVQTFNLEDVSGRSNFFANGVLVHNAADCDSNTPSSGGGSTLSFSSLSTEYDETQIKQTSQQVDVTIHFDASSTFISSTEYQENNVESSNYDYYNLGTKHNNNMFSIFSETDEKTNLLRLIVDRFPIPLKTPFIKRLLYLDQDQTSEEDKTNPIDDNNPGEDNSNSIAEDTSSTNDIISDISSNDYLGIKNPEKELVFLWDFGDGNIGYGINPVHTYSVDISDVSLDRRTTYTSYADSNIADDLPVDTIDDFPIDDPININLMQELVSYEVTLIILDEYNKVISVDTTTISIEVPITTFVNRDKDIVDDPVTTDPEYPKIPKDDELPIDEIYSFSGKMVLTPF